MSDRFVQRNAVFEFLPLNGNTLSISDKIPIFRSEAQELIDVISTILIGLCSDRGGAGIGAVFANFQKQREALGAYQNEHIARAVRRAALRAAKGCVERAVERAGGADQLVLPLKEGQYRPDWASGQPNYFPADQAIHKINDEIKALYRKETEGSQQELFHDLREVVGNALDGFPAIEESTAVQVVSQVMYSEILTLGEWDGEPDELRDAFFDENQGFLFAFKDAIHREIKDPQSSEFGKIYNALTLRAIEGGVEKLDEKLDTVIGSVQSFHEFLQMVVKQQYQLGPFNWKVERTSGYILAEHQTEETDISTKLKLEISELQNLIRSLENFHSNPEGIYYIGQTLIRIDSYLDDNGIAGEPPELVNSLMREIDEDTRRQEGLLEPYLNLTSINTLKRALKQILAEIIQLKNTLSHDAKLH